HAVASLPSARFLWRTSRLSSEDGDSLDPIYHHDFSAKHVISFNGEIRGNKRPVNERLNSIIRDVRYPAIDGIRWYAAFIVFFVHASNPVAALLKTLPVIHHEEPSQFALRAFEIVSRGQFGVDVFFIISGFLMGRIIVSRGQSFSYSAFIRS